MGGFGSGHLGAFGGGPGSGEGHFGGFGGRCMAIGSFNRGLGRSVAAAVANFPERVFLNPGSTE